MQWHFTIDADWVPGSEVGLENLLDFCDRWKLKATIFFAGRFAETYTDLIRECQRRGHELGTHGWKHGGIEEDEDFRSASYDQQREWIRRATEAVEKASGVRPVVFRAPNLWISETTLRALEDALLNFPGCAVVISHDRWFLDRIATHILAFEGNSEVVWFEGNYQDYVEDLRRRRGEDAAQPHRLKYRKLTR